MLVLTTAPSTQEAALRVRRSRTASMALPRISSTVTSLWSQSHVPRSPRCRITSAAWSGHLRGHHRCTVTSTTTSTRPLPKNSNALVASTTTTARSARPQARTQTQRAIKTTIEQALTQASSQPWPAPTSPPTHERHRSQQARGSSGGGIGDMLGI